MNKTRLQSHKLAIGNKNNPHLNIMKGTVLGDKEQGVGIGDEGKGIRDKGYGIRDKG